MRDHELQPYPDGLCQGAFGVGQLPVQLVAMGHMRDLVRHC
jgi:hypothetical protein